MKSTTFTQNVALIFLSTVTVAACVPGQYTTAPLPAGGLKKSSASGNAQAGNPGGDPSVTGTPNATATAANTNTNPNSNPPSGLRFVPGVPEVDALRKCMNLWGTVPFTEVKPSQVNVMDVSVGVGGGLLGSTPLAGLGNLLNFGNTKDLEVTNEPRLIVIPLSVSVGGNTTFELMNPNGWYCMKTAVGAKSTVNIKLNCKAKLAQSDLGVSVDTLPGADAPVPVKVGINDGRTPGGQLGIMVDSSVNLTRVNDAGVASCTP